MDQVGIQHMCFRQTKTFTQSSLVELTGISHRETITGFFNLLTKLASVAYRLWFRGNHRIPCRSTRAGAVPRISAGLSIGCFGQGPR
ncbi:hypothetical protein TNCV_1587221 [Trichonephila clavipes]|nr:hypothetical protein TNCV_1587221 [Trichonephila clavipes]